MSPGAWLVSMAVRALSSPNETFRKKDLSLPNFRTFSVKQRKPSLVRLPRSLSFPLASCHCLWQRWGGCGSPGKGGRALLLPTISIIHSPLRYFPAHICFARVSIYTQTHGYTFIHAHTPTLDIHSCIYTHLYGDPGPSESASDSFLPCSYISINKCTTPTSFPAERRCRRVG